MFVPLFVLLGACAVTSCGSSSSGNGSSGTASSGTSPTGGGSTGTASSGTSPTGGGTCGTVQPCGGNVVGTWKAADACITGAPTSVTMGTCTVATSYSIEVSGTATFNTNMTYTADAQITITTTLNLPASCLTQQGITLMCADLSGLIGASADTDAGGNTSCVSASTGGCACTLIETNAATASAGMYTTSGDTITTTDSTGGSASPSTSSYCVSGSQFHLLSSSSTGADGGGPTETVDVVFTM